MAQYPPQYQAQYPPLNISDYQQKLRLLNKIKQYVSTHQNNQNNQLSKTDQVLIDGHPIASGRFGNQAVSQSNNQIHREPYYVSGVPMADHQSIPTYNPVSHNTVPYNGLSVKRNSSEMVNTDCQGSNYSDFKVADVEACKNACIADNKCLTWSYDKRNQHCYLKNNATVPCNYDDAFTSGRVQSTHKFGKS